MYALADGNNFFASCERVFRPDLEHKPVLVLSNNDGCVIARSAEVKALGIAMGVPYFKVKDLCRQHGVHVFSSNFQLYGDMSGRMMSILAQHAYEMAPYSIDECFLDLGEGSAAGMVEAMREARRQVGQFLGLPVSIGIAPTKVLAKAANRWAKKQPETGGVFLLDMTNREAVLRAMAVGELWGIGPNLEAALTRFRITTAWDLAQADPKNLRRHFNVFMERLILELRGTPCFKLAEGLAKHPTIQSTRSFGRPVTELKELEESVATYASRAAVKLRHKGLLAQTVLVYIKTNKHRPEQPQYAASHMVALPHATADTTLLVCHAQQALRQIYRRGHSYKKAGVWLGEIIEAKAYQADLFSPGDSPDNRNLMAALDALNTRYGQATVRHAACGLNSAWGMRASQRSGNYTTSWHELLRVGHPATLAPAGSRSLVSRGEEGNRIPKPIGGD